MTPRKLYFVRGCPFAHRAWISLQLKGIDVEPVCFERGKRPPELEAVGPFARSPTLFDGDVAVWDSQVVIEYLEDRYPNEPLLPPDPAKRAHARMFIARMGSELAKLIGYAGGAVYGPPDENALAGMKSAMEPLASYDAALAGPSFVLGDSLTLADVCLYTPFHALLRFWGIDLPEALIHLRAWRERVLEVTKQPSIWENA